MYTNTINRYRRRVQLLAALLILLGLLLGLTPVMQAESVDLTSVSEPEAPSTAETYTLYFPLLEENKPPPVEPPPVEPPPVEPPPASAGALLLGDKSYRSAGMAVDRQGGMHAVFIRVAPFETTGESAPVYYAYCAPANLSACADRSTWQLTELEPQHFTHAQIEVTPEGRPRLMLMGFSADPTGGISHGHLYRYGECDGGCATASNWRFTTVLTSNSSGGLYETDYSYQNFELDHIGRPRFVYQDLASRTDQAARGAWYVFCDADCGTHSAEAPTWFQTRIDNPAAGYHLSLDEQTVLRFTADGRPRVLAGSASVQYVECNENCSDGANWSQAADLISTGSGSSVRTWSLAIDSQGRPRATIYPRGGPFLYAWCTRDCWSADNWEGAELAFGADSGAYSSLVLDSRDRPRIAYRDAGANLGYAWCDTNCEAPGAQWSFGKIEDGNDILRDLNVPILPECVRGGWFGGMRPVLALDPNGNPRIAYDAEFKMECKRYPDDPNSTLTFVETKWWTSRVLFAPHP